MTAVPTDEDEVPTDEGMMPIKVLLDSAKPHGLEVEAIWSFAHHLQGGATFLGSGRSRHTGVGSVTDPRTAEERMNTIGATQRRATADEILARIVSDLTLINTPWRQIDVDDRNSVVSAWREKISEQLEAYF